MKRYTKSILILPLFAALLIGLSADAAIKKGPPVKNGEAAGPEVPHRRLRPRSGVSPRLRINDAPSAPENYIERVVDAPLAPEVPHVETEHEKAFWEERSIPKHDDNNLKHLSPAGRAYLVKNIKNAQQALRMMRAKYFEMDHSIKRVAEARMIRGNAMLYGLPGATKSALVSDFIFVKEPRPDGSTEMPATQLMLDQLMSPSAIKGVRLYSRIGQKITSYKDFDLSEAVITKRAVLIDELANGNARVYSSSLDVLNERLAKHPGLTLRTNTESVYTTSNQTVYEFLNTMKEQGLQTVASAFLDRLTFKTLNHNWIIQDGVRVQAMEHGMRRNEEEAANRRANPRAYDKPIEQQMEAFESKLPYVDWTFLGDVAEMSFRFDPITVRELNELLKVVRGELNKKTRESQEAVKREPEEAKDAFFPSQGVSMRYVMTAAPRAIKASVFYDLLSISEVPGFPDYNAEFIAKLLEQHIPLDRSSIWRVQDSVITAAVGDARLGVKDDGNGNAEFTLDYDNDKLDLLLADAQDEREKTMIEYVKHERGFISGHYKGLVDRNQATSRHVADLLAQLGFPTGSRIPKNPEEVIFFLQGRWAEIQNLK
jgi:hypothetical protein